MNFGSWCRAAWRGCAAVARSWSAPHRAPFLNASWLEELVWSDVRRFLENPGETLDKLRARQNAGGEAPELEARHADLTKRLAAKQAEKDRYIRTFAQGHISEEELETYILDLKNQIENLRLLIESVDADLSRRREQAEIAETTHAWLLALRERLSEVERDIEDAFRARRKLVRLLVAEVSAGEKREDGTSEVRITYRFDPPDEPEKDGDRGLVVSTVPNGTPSLQVKRSRGSTTPDSIGGSTVPCISNTHEPCEASFCEKPPRRFR